MTNFLDDHPGGSKAIELYAGRDASEEFNMLLVQSSASLIMDADVNPHLVTTPKLSRK